MERYGIAGWALPLAFAVHVVASFHDACVIGDSRDKTREQVLAHSQQYNTKQYSILRGFHLPYSEHISQLSITLAGDSLSARSRAISIGTI